jgi:hypothetical protein
MTETGNASDKERAQNALKMTLAGVIGQVGCLTLAIIAIALVAGLWLDQQFGTQPILTLVLVLASVPVTLYLMFRIVLSVAPKIQLSMEAGSGEAKRKAEEEPEGGERPGEDEKA